MIAVGDHLWNSAPELLVRASCPFGGGVGGCREELCGLLSGGTLLLGALRGRLSPEENDKPLFELVCAFRERFAAYAGGTLCEPVRSQYPEVDKRCAPLTEEATRLLMELMAEADIMPAQR